MRKSSKAPLFLGKEFTNRVLSSEDNGNKETNSTVHLIGYVKHQPGESTVCTFHYFIINKYFESSNDDQYVSITM